MSDKKNNDLRKLLSIYNKQENDNDYFAYDDSNNGGVVDDCCECSNACSGCSDCCGSGNVCCDGICGYLLCCS